MHVLHTTLHTHEKYCICQTVWPVTGSGVAEQFLVDARGYLLVRYELWRVVNGSAVMIGSLPIPVVQDVTARTHAKAKHNSAKC
jgi:hypothetical protein